MLVTGFPAGVWATNCWVVAAEPGSECLIIDPGQDSFDGIRDLVDQHRLKPVAVMITHGHLDHTWSVVPVCSSYEVPALIHCADRDRLGDPMSFMGPQMRNYIESMSNGSLEFAEPSSVTELRTDGSASDLIIAGVSLSVHHMPGHTPGSVVFHAPASQTLFSGDVLFNQGIGRTDLPGGDTADMARSLRRMMATFADETQVMPGHGATTTIGAEREHSPFLREFLEMDLS